MGTAKTNPNIFTSEKNVSCESFEKNICHIADKVTEAILISCREMTCNAFYHDRDRFITKNIMVSCRDKIIDPSSYSIGGIIFMMLLGVAIVKVLAYLAGGLLAVSYEFFVKTAKTYPEQLGWVGRSYDHSDEQKTIARKELDVRFNSSQCFFHNIEHIARSQLTKDTTIVRIPPDSEPESFKLKIE